MQTGSPFEAGTRLRWERVFTAEEVLRFAELSGDRGVHHVAPGEAGRLMLHGLLIATMPTKLGGDLNFIARKMDFDFLSPAYTGDRLVCCGKIEAVQERRARWKVGFSFEVTNQNGKAVMRGKSSGTILRKSQPQGNWRI